MGFREKHIYGLTDQGRHKIVYNDWGDDNDRPIVCVHGLTGNGHDFDVLAEHLTRNEYRLICPDLAGRGRSDFLQDPLDYNYEQYLQDLNTLLAYEGLDEAGSVDWLGVSLGGLLGMRLAAMENSPIERLILNDIGPDVPREALDFIHDVISVEYSFDTVGDLEQRMRQTRGLTWGPVTDEQWRHMAEHNARGLDDGRLTYAYDPRISVIFKNEPIGAINLWEAWGNIACPTLLIHGTQSMLLTADIVKAMEESGPDFDYLPFADCGHVPSLMANDQIQKVQAWLQKTA